MNTLADRLQAIRARIDHAKSSIGRNDTVQFCAVSKAQGAEKIRLAYELVSVFLVKTTCKRQSKSKRYCKTAIEWHFIGPIQSNKTSLIAEHFDWVHSVDRLKIAQRLSNARSPKRAPLNVCLQINSSNELSKSGVNIEDALALAQAVKALPNLKLRGIMSIPAPAKNPEQQRAQFRAVRQTYDTLRQAGVELDTLSIGMSDDFEAAIAEGATIVRIGSALFGARQSPT
jgi:PLP dependent protein